MPHPHRFQLLQGDRHSPVRVGSVDLVMAPRDDPPFPVSIQVVEEDTWRLLSADAVLRPAFEHPTRLMTSLIDERPARPGDLLPKGARWRAVVYDLDQEPICREEWVLAVLSNLLKTAAKRDCHSLALPLLGSTHGGLTWQQSLALIAQVFGQPPIPSTVRRVWLVIGSVHLPAARSRLADLLAS